MWLSQPGKGKIRVRNSFDGQVFKIHTFARPALVEELKIFPNPDSFSAPESAPAMTKSWVEGLKVS